MKPSDFTTYPWNSVTENSECETVALNVMKILKRTGDAWRDLSPEEYRNEREKDGRFTASELPILERIRSYTVSAEAAKRFSREWAKR